MLIQAYSEIADSLRRFERLQQSFTDKEELYPTFAVFYADILHFHKVAYQFVTRRCEHCSVEYVDTIILPSLGWKVLFITSWGRFKPKFGIIIDNLKKHGELIDKEVNAYNIIEARETRRSLEAWKNETLERFAREDKEQGARQILGLSTWLGVDDSDQVMIEESLTKAGSDYPGTVDWVLRSPEMAQWLRPTYTNSFLWLRGGPGTGKSVITASLLGFLGSSNLSLVIRHFCSYTYISSIQYDRTIKNLLLQCIRDTGDLIAQIYEEHVGSKPPTLSLIEGLLETAIEVRSGASRNPVPLYILIDGLDEFPTDGQRRLIRIMGRLVGKGGNCKVMFSSRDSMALRERFKTKACISLSEEKAHLRAATTTFAELRLLSMHHKLEELGISEQGLKAIAFEIGVRSDGRCRFLPYTLTLRADRTLLRHVSLGSISPELPLFQFLLQRG